MKIILNYEQRKALSNFFVGIAVAWFVAAFITPNVAQQLRPLNFIIDLVNMMGSIYISLFLLRKDKI